MRKQIKSFDRFDFKLLKIFSPTFRALQRFVFKSYAITFGVNLTPGLFRDSKVNETLFRRGYRMHNSNIRQRAPKEKLLQINFKDGWKPLCDFLELPVPVEDFPHKNKNAEVTEELFRSHPVCKNMPTELYIGLSLVICLLSYLLVELLL